MGINRQAGVLSYGNLFVQSLGARDEYLDKERFPYAPVHFMKKELFVCGHKRNSSGYFKTWKLKGPYISGTLHVNIK